jgi:hypothetical protein
MATVCSLCGAAVRPGHEHLCPVAATPRALQLDATALAPAARPNPQKSRAADRLDAATPAGARPAGDAATPMPGGETAARIHADTLADDEAVDDGERAAALDEDLIGKTVADRYQIVRRIGEGGMGAVYLGRHVVLESAVAVKVLLAPHDPDSQMRFLREAKLASSVHHPNTVYISDFGVLPGGQLFLVMEMLRGRSLAEVLASGPLPAARACRIALQIVRGLVAIHEKGIVHRES